MLLEVDLVLGLVVADVAAEHVVGARVRHLLVVLQVARSLEALRTLVAAVVAFRVASLDVGLEAPPYIIPHYMSQLHNPPTFKSRGPAASCPQILH